LFLFDFRNGVIKASVKGLRTLGYASRHVKVVLNIVVNAAIAISKYAHFPRLIVYILMNCSAKIQPTDDNCSPEPNITNSPKVKNPKAKKAVPIYPILKSSNDSFKDTLTLVSFFFATVHNECHTETLRGAGIQPTKANKKAISILLCQLN